MLEQICECRKCDLPFSSTNPARVIIVCGDVFCLACITKMFGTKPRARCPHLGCNASFKRSQHISVYFPTKSIDLASTNSRIGDQFRRKNEKLNRQRVQITKLQEEIIKVKAAVESTRIEKQNMTQAFRQVTQSLVKAHRKDTAKLASDYQSAVTDHVRLILENINLNNQPKSRNKKSKTIIFNFNYFTYILFFILIFFMQERY